MASGRLRIGAGSPAAHIMSAEYGQYNLTGIVAGLNYLGAGVSLYTWDDLTPFAYVDPAKTASGTGTIGDPYNPTQGLAIGPAASGDRVIIWLPGDLNLTGTGNPSGAKFAQLYPVSGASSTRRVIHKAQYPGVTDPVLRTRIRRTSGSGVLFGFFNNAYAVWDGFTVDTKAGGVEPGIPDDPWGEVGQMSAWTSNNCKFIRIYSDHQFANYAGGDRNNIFIQDCSFIEIGDGLYKNIGPSAGGASLSNVTLMMWYNSDNINVHHCDMFNAPTAIWCKGQTSANTVHTHTYHHNKIYNCGVAIRVSSPIQTLLANSVKAYQNQIFACHVGLAVTAFGSGGEPKGVAFVNNTIYNLARYGSSDVYGISTVALMYINTTATSYAADCNIITRNNACYNVNEMTFTLDNSAQFDNMVWDYDAYNTYTNFWRQGEGGPTQNLATWQAESPSRDSHVVTASPGFVDVSGNNIALAGGSPLLNAGIDILNLNGNGTAAACHIGAWLGSGDVFGRRVA